MVPNTSPQTFDMATVLLWSTSIAQFVGSEAQALWAPMKRPWVLLLLSFIHFLMFPFIVYYALAKFWVNNVFTIVYMIVMVVFNGYLISESYRLCTPNLHKSNYQAAHLFINIALYVGVYVGITTPVCF